MVLVVLLIINLLWMSLMVRKEVLLNFLLIYLMLLFKAFLLSQVRLISVYLENSCIFALLWLLLKFYLLFSFAGFYIRLPCGLRDIKKQLRTSAMVSFSVCAAAVEWQFQALLVEFLHIKKSSRKVCKSPLTSDPSLI